MKCHNKCMTFLIGPFSNAVGEMVVPVVGNSSIGFRLIISSNMPLKIIFFLNRKYHINCHEHVLQM